MAVQAARNALAGPWGRLTATERGRVLVRIGQAVAAHADELARIEARDTGKPMTTAHNDIDVLARYFEFNGSAADKVHGQVIPFLAGHQVSLLREPLGVTGGSGGHADTADGAQLAIVTTRQAAGGGRRAAGRRSSIASAASRRPAR